MGCGSLLVVESTITIGVDELSRKEWKKLFEALTFMDADEQENYYYRLHEADAAVEIPRGAWSLLPEHVRYRDARNYPVGEFLRFERELDRIDLDPRFERQREAVDEMLEQQQGIVVRPPGTGKTNILIAFACEVGTPSLVLVHTKDILNQWLKEVETAVPELSGKVGVIGSGQFQLGAITIATVQTLIRMLNNGEWEWTKKFGALLIDETHHAPASTWEQILNTIPARFRLGCTASPTRADGMEKAIEYLIGPTIHKMKFASSVPVSVERVNTNFFYPLRGKWDWSRMLDRLENDVERNELIARKVNAQIRNGNSVLVLSRRITHLENLARLIETPKHAVLTGQKSKSERKRLLDGFRRGKLHCLLATQLADEAVDIPRLNCVALTFPGKAEGRLIQQVGRALRKYEGKEQALILDFVDKRMPKLLNHWGQRQRIYRKNGIKVERRFSLGKRKSKGQGAKEESRRNVHGFLNGRRKASVATPSRNPRSGK